ncbi:MAG: hypothetical protein KAJ12_06520 [Bacteroidetes bacterium]|nr:hypothetical protein [Bacteroidota bacterium]
MPTDGGSGGGMDGTLLYRSFSSAGLHSWSGFIDFMVWMQYFFATWVAYIGS